MCFFRKLFGLRKSVEPNWYPPMPEPEPEKAKTPYRTAPDMPVEDREPSPAPDIKLLFTEVVQNQSDALSAKEKAFFTEDKVKVLYKALINAMIKGAHNGGDRNDCLSYVDLGNGMTEDLMYPFFKMAKKEFLSLDINLSWKTSYNYIWFSPSEFRTALSKIPNQKVLYFP